MAGSSVDQNEDLDTCNNMINYNLIDNMALAGNKTGDIFRAGCLFCEDIVFSTFDLLMILADLSSGLHPVAFHCWNAGEYVYEHYKTKVTESSSFKPYLMNFVYNFGLVFDSLRDWWIFLTNDPRGQDDGVYNAGDSLGQAVYYLIDPNLQLYETQALDIDAEVENA